MAMTEKSRSALYVGLSSVVEEEAVQEMLSYFPARDVEEPVTKEFLRAELTEGLARMGAELRSEFRAELRSEIGGLRSELQSEIGGLRSELQSEIGELRSELQSEIGGLRTELREEIRRMVWVNLGGFVAFAAVIIAAVRL